MGNNMHNKPKIGSTAIPFLLTALISLIVVGGAALYILDKLENQNQSNDNSDDISYASYYVPEQSNDKTLLLVFEPDDDAAPNTFMLMRILPKSLKYVFIPLPSNTLMETGQSEMILSEHYASGGILQIKNAVENELSISIDRYIIMDSQALQKICNILGNANFVVPDGVKFLDPGLQYLAATQIEKLINYTNYKNGEQQRMVVAGSIAMDMFNQTDGERVSGLLDDNFKIVINMIQTDISAIDYSDNSKALKYLLERAYEPAELRMPYGIETEDGKFVMNEGFVDGINEWFEIENAAQTSADSESTT